MSSKGLHIILQTLEGLKVGLESDIEESDKATLNTTMGRVLDAVMDNREYHHEVITRYVVWLTGYRIKKAARECQRDPYEILPYTSIPKRGERL
jgi:hypothetical protein